MSESKTHWKKLHNPDYLGAWSLEPGKDLTLSIKEVKQESVTGTDGKKEDCTVAHFNESVKPMILNSTNSKTIEKIYDTPYIEDWRGKYIQLYIARVRAFGEEVDALRVRPYKPQVNKPELTPAHNKWASAIDSLKSGKTTIEGIEKHFMLSDQNATKLKEAAK